jgi:hypothetical protein
MVFGVIWVITVPLLLILPVVEACLLFTESWLYASIVPVVWILLFLFMRSRWFKAERQDFPNDQENV